METLGSQFKQAREEKNFTLDYVARSIRIRTTHLVSIEEERFNAIPGGQAYVVGFIRNYADFLGLPAAEMVERYRSINASTPEPKLDFKTLPAEARAPNTSIIIISLVVVIGLVIFWLNSGSTPQPEDSGAIIPPPSFVTSAPPITPPAATVAPAPTPEAATTNAPIIIPQETPPPQPTAPEPAATTPAKVEGRATTEAPPSPVVETVQSSLASIIAASASSLEKMAEKLPTPPPAPVATPKPPAAPAATLAATEPAAAPKPAPAKPAPTVQFDPALADQPVAIQAISDTWVRLYDTNERRVLFSGLLKGGQVYAMPDRKGLVMRVGNAGGIVILVNGRPQPSLGPNGVVRDNIRVDTYLNRGAAVQREQRTSQAQTSPVMQENY